MAYEFRLPDIGEGLTEATVVRWMVDVGDEIGLDEPMVEVETDKAVVEIPAPRAGVVLYRGAGDGEVMPVGDVLVVIGDPGEQWVRGSAEVAVPRSSPAASAPIVGTLDERAETIAPADGPPTGDGGGRGRPLALPLVRRLADRLGVALESVEGSGPGGRITRQDVELAATTVGPGRRVKMSSTRRAIARNLTRSWREIPHVTTYAEAAAEAMLGERTRTSEELGRPVPLEALLIARIVPLLRRHPEFNAVVDGDEIVYRETYDIGFAVAAPGGLLVAVVRGAGERSVGELADEVTRLAGAAVDRSITADEMRGATFTVSNIGAVGGGFGTPIIPYGTAAILSVGRAAEQPVVRDGVVVIGRQFPLSLSYDHRLVDGAAGRAFMADLIMAMES